VPGSPGWRETALVRRGFLPVSRELYRLDEQDREEFLSDRERELTWPINGGAAGLLDDKLAFFFMLRYLRVPTPEILGSVLRGRIVLLGDGGSGAAAPSDWLRAIVERQGAAVVKSARGGGGQQVFIVRRLDGEFELNGRRDVWPAIERRLLSLENYLVSTFVDQAGYARAIFPQAVNTIRILTMHDAEGAFVATAVHRFGTERSLPVDNWSRGGLSARVSLGDGILGPGVAFPESGAVAWHDAHPDTASPIRGVAVPGWERIRDGVLALAAQTPFLPYVGWDVVVTDGGFEVLEGNKYSDVNLLQVHGPLLRDERVRAFYRAHGVLRR
jgi:Sugar-transfer associated ATP-grasp